MDAHEKSMRKAFVEWRKPRTDKKYLKQRSDGGYVGLIVTRDWLVWEVAYTAGKLNRGSKTP